MKDYKAAIELLESWRNAGPEEIAEQRASWKALEAALSGTDMGDPLTTARAEGYSAGYAAAREDAAKVAQNWLIGRKPNSWTSTQTCNGIAEVISALSATEETK